MSKKEKEIVSLEELATKSEKKATKKKSTVPVIETDIEVSVEMTPLELANSMFQTTKESDEETHKTNPFMEVDKMVAPIEMNKKLREMFVKIFKDVSEDFDINSLEYNYIDEITKFMKNKQSSLSNSNRSQINLMLVNFVKGFESIKSTINGKNKGIPEKEYEVFEAIAKTTIRSMVNPSKSLEEIDSLTESLKEVYPEDEIVSLQDILKTEIGRMNSKYAVIPKTPYQYYTVRDRSEKLSLSERRRKYPMKYPC